MGEMKEEKKKITEMINEQFRSFSTSHGLTFSIGYEGCEKVAIIRDFSSGIDHEFRLNQGDLENILDKMRLTV